MIHWGSCTLAAVLASTTTAEGAHQFFKDKTEGREIIAMSPGI